MLAPTIRAADFFGTPALNAVLLKQLCEDFSSDCTCSLHCTEVRLFYRANATWHLFKLECELLQ